MIELKNLIEKIDFKSYFVEFFGGHTPADIKNIENMFNTMYKEMAIFPEVYPTMYSWINNAIKAGLPGMDIKFQNEVDWALCHGYIHPRDTLIVVVTDQELILEEHWIKEDALFNTPIPISIPKHRSKGGSLVPGTSLNDCVSNGRVLKIGNLPFFIKDMSLEMLLHYQNAINSPRYKEAIQIELDRRNEIYMDEEDDIRESPKLRNISDDFALPIQAALYTKLVKELNKKSLESFEEIHKQNEEIKIFKELLKYKKNKSSINSDLNWDDNSEEDYLNKDRDEEDYLDEDDEDIDEIDNSVVYESPISKYIPSIKKIDSIRSMPVKTTEAWVNPEKIAYEKYKF